jgi:hypothetical protein
MCKQLPVKVISIAFNCVTVISIKRTSFALSTSLGDVHKNKKMKKVKFYVMYATLAAIVLTALPSCKKGSDDPLLSLVTRKARFTNTWTLIKYEKNGVGQNLSGSTYIYNTFSDGTLKQTVEGSIFGFPVRTVNDGTWTFLNDDEDVNITISSFTTLYNIQRLASKELWLKRISGTDTYVYYFEAP